MKLDDYPKTWEAAWPTESRARINGGRRIEHSLCSPPTDNNPGNSFPVPRPSPAPRNYRPPLLQPPTTHARVAHGRFGSVRLSPWLAFACVCAHVRLAATEAVLAARRSFVWPLQARVEASRHYATVYLERRQYFVRGNEWPCRWLDGWPGVGWCAWYQWQ